MDQHNLDLLGNAIDSLVEALEKFEQGERGEPKGYKFAVLHMAHFVELTFKYHITEKHPLLIFSQPFAPTLNTQKTIGLWEAVNFINNEKEGTVSKEFRTDLAWLKDLRNQIEHHKFEMKVAEVRSTMGRLFRAMMEFIVDYTDLDIESKIPDNVKETFKVLSDEYEMQLRDAMKLADEVEAANQSNNPFEDDGDPPRVECTSCGHYTMVVNQDSATGYRCTFCFEEESDDMPCDCDGCGVRTTRGDLYRTLTDDGEELRCYICSGRYLADKED